MKTPDEVAGARTMSLFKAEQKRIESIDSLHTHLEQSTFVRTPIEITPFTPKIKSLKTPGLQRKMTQAQKNAYERKQRDSLNIDTSLGKVEELKIEQPSELQTSPATKEKVTQDVFSLPKIAQKEKVTQDVFSLPKIAQKGKVTQDVFSLPKIAQKEKGVLIPSTAYMLPFVGQDVNLYPTQKQKQRNSALSLPVLSVPTISDTTFSPATTQKTDPFNINPPSISPKQKTDPIPPQIPDVPQPEVIPPSNPFEGGTSGGSINWIPQFNVPKSKKIVPLGAEDFNFDIADGLTPKRRKTKNKTMKNKYGDPFDIKIKFKL